MFFASTNNPNVWCVDERGNEDGTTSVYWSLKINGDIFLLFPPLPEKDAPSPDGPNVHNVVTEFGVDPTGETESTHKAIDAAERENYFYGAAMGRGNITNIELRDVSRDFPWRSVMRGVAPRNTIPGVEIHSLRIQGNPVTSLQDGDFHVTGPVTDVTFHNE